MTKNNHQNTRTAAVRGSSLNESQRTIEAVITTDNPVAVYDRRTGQVIDEVLTADGARFGEQIPIYDSHWQDSSNQLGSARSITREEGNHVATLHFASDAGRFREETWQMVRQKHFTNVSIGYQYARDAFIDIAAGQTATVDGKEYTATPTRLLRVVREWTGVEVSTVSRGADPDAKMREIEVDSEPLVAGVDNSGSQDGKTDSNKHARTGDEMAKDATTETAPATQDPPAAPVVTERTAPAPAAPAIQVADTSEREAGARLERERISFANKYRGDVSNDVVDKAIEDGESVDSMRKIFLDHLLENRRGDADEVDNDVEQHRGQHQVSGDHQTARSGQRGQLAREFALAMILRAGIEIDSPVLRSDQASHMMRQRGVDGSWIVNASRSLDATGSLGDIEQAVDAAHRRQSLPMRDLVRAALESEGVRCSSFDEGELMERAISSATVTAMFTLAFNAQVIAGFVGIADTTASWTKPDTLPNFQAAERIQSGKYSRLKLRQRGGVPEHGTIDAKAESLQVFEFASKFIVDEQDLIDNTFGNIRQSTPGEMGESAGELAPDLAYAVLLGNPDMADAVALFHASRGNLFTRDLDYANLVLGRKAFATQTDAVTGRHVSVRGDVLLVPEALEPTASELVSNTAKLTGTTGYNANAGKHTVVSEPRLDVGVENPLTGTFTAGEPTRWYLGASKGRYGMALATLDGRGRSPRTRRLRNVNDGYAFGWSVDHVVGCAPLGTEGLQKN